MWIYKRNSYHEFISWGAGVVSFAAEAVTLVSDRLKQ